MTPKEKAGYLLHKMYVVDAYDDYDDVSMEYRYAKRCALIAVDEIIDLVKHIDVDSEDYWQEVKHEIEKL
jgi:hypothetical protein